MVAALAAEMAGVLCAMERLVRRPPSACVLNEIVDETVRTVDVKCGSGTLVKFVDDA